MVVEDGATPHPHGFHHNMYSFSQIKKVFWLGYSPDINMIEPLWADKKNVIRKAGSLHSIEEAIEQFKQLWKGH